jgi:hypothetical protein
MRTAITSVLLFSIIAGAAVGLGQGPNEPKASAITPLMHQKLDRSKTILEGLALEDLNKVGRNARMLKLLSLESGWNVIQTEEYRIQSNDFRRACETISEAAEAKDLHRATLGYVALTLRCVECHSYMRKHRSELMKLDLN